ncbi:enoyl-CoA hydratase/isomerase family protein [Thalassotalea ponticola]|uniref:enoyl-CoA hydratase/isomerase family protein n=1 Tax=Thalassotalea ponticola TaxID=1523392 RepID=UPI0025B4FEB6|nr:enoyl-CoA hydratase/isomerase family protein [Thalassotalea ponticola]MDN3653268.1 enoyl-CoA hydratase/isomerase family protein [Thalassotalea ponticola]
MSDVVLFDQIDCLNDKKIAVITLNAPKSLNALSHAMVQQITPQLELWQSQPEVVAVFVQGSGDKAFCAGGDIVHLYNNMPAEGGKEAPQVEQFFCDEYKLDFLIHNYPKPIVVWGNGIVMGGGLGLMAGASHRIVTENTRIAMPEISIGLYPDVGGSYFLNNMPNRTGLFLGLTGASINATDAMYVNLADYFIGHQQQQTLLDNLSKISWSGDLSTQKQQLETELSKLAKLSQELAPPSVVAAHQSLIDKVMSGEDLKVIVDNIVNEQIDDKWFNKAQNSLAHGSPLSAVITYHQWLKGQQMNLAECFQMELVISKKCAQFGEFKEGVRALLIEKDNQPHWRYPDVASVDETVVDWFFDNDYEQGAHPLQQLEQ